MNDMINLLHLAAGLTFVYVGLALSLEKKTSRSRGRRVSALEEELQEFHSQRLEQAFAIHNRVEEIQSTLDDSIDRLNDILLQDDGQAYKEAEKFLDRVDEKRKIWGQSPPYISV